VFPPVLRPGGCVFEPEHKLRHLAFFDEIAAHDEGDREWRDSVAGLVALRLVDRWLEEGPTFTTEDTFAVRGVEAAIEEMDAGTPLRILLGRVLNALCERKPDVHVVVTPLLAYAQQLEFDAKWTLATDVYHSVLAHLHPQEDTDACVAAHLRLGSCYRALNRIPEAMQAYNAATQIATAGGDMVGILRARVGESAIAILKGNLPQAQEILEDTIARATGDSLRDVRSRALHERASVAKYRGQYELAIRFGYEALNDSQNPAERDRILADIAGAFVDLGVYSAARDAYLVLSVTALEQYTRWGATLNLMDLAVQTNSQTLFEHYRRELAPEQLPPFFATAYHLNAGVGHRVFGSDEAARHQLQLALAMATEHGFNQLLFDAEEALLDMTKPRMQPQEQSRDLPLDVQEVAAAIRQMRESVGV
ncbi:MAG TPA: hypothetical protein VJ867_01940, partial [Gemmatimonadaceae bacterium]|nr:hypothetical protein [Gemmatimonadaceae bacterium]